MRKKLDAGTPGAQALSAEEIGNLYRLRQAKKLLDLFEGAHGHPPATMKEFQEWCVSPEGKAALAYDLTADGKIIPD
jgi:hypothetical protein